MCRQVNPRHVFTRKYQDMRRKAKIETCEDKQTTNTCVDKQTMRQV